MTPASRVSTKHTVPVSFAAGALGSTVGEFDDIVVWLSRYTLFNRMVAAGKLP